MKALSITDLLALHVGYFPIWFSSITGSYKLYMTETSCKAKSYFSDVIESYAGWVLCIITLERVIVIVVPHKALQICTKRLFSSLLMLILLIISLLFTSAWFNYIPAIEFVFDPSEIHFEVLHVCVYYLSAEAYKWISLLLYSLLPFFLMGVGNIIILAVLHKHVKNRKRIATNDGKTQNTFLTKRLVSVTVAYIILTSPNVIYLMINSTAFRKSYHSNDEHWGAMQLWTSISRMLVLLNHSINFFLYIIAGKKFRGEFIKMMKCLILMH